MSTNSKLVLMDPFLARKYNQQSMPYLADVHKTYNKNIPTPTFERAIQFREKERAQIDAVLAENEELRGQVGSITKALHRAKHGNPNIWASVDWDSVFNSNRVTYGSSSASRTDSSSVVRVSPDEAAASSDAQRSGDLSGEVLPSVGVHDSRGQASEHSDEGRSSEDDGLNGQSTSSDIREQ